MSKQNKFMREKYGTKKERDASYLFHMIDYKPQIADLIPNKRIALENQKEVIVYLLTIGGEARGEPKEGQRGVAGVILNRWYQQKDYFGLTVSEVCTKNVERLWQFSAWSPRNPNRKWMKNPEPLELGKIANNCLGLYYSGETFWPDKRVCYYKHVDLPDSGFWQNLELVETIGNHDFYRDRRLSS